MDADGKSGLQVVAGQLHDGIGDPNCADGDVPLPHTQLLVQHGVGAHD